jgi:hypothetical protein
MSIWRDDAVEKRVVWFFEMLMNVMIGVLAHLRQVFDMDVFAFFWAGTRSGGFYDRTIFTSGTWFLLLFGAATWETRSIRWRYLGIIIGV